MKAEARQKESKNFFDKEDDKEIIVNFDNKIDKRIVKSNEHENYATGTMSPYDVLDLTDDNVYGSSIFFRRNDECFTDLQKNEHINSSCDAEKCIEQGSLKLSDRIVLKFNYNESCSQKFVTSTDFQC